MLGTAGTVSAAVVTRGVCWGRRGEWWPRCPWQPSAGLPPSRPAPGSGAEDVLSLQRLGTGVGGVAIAGRAPPAGSHHSFLWAVLPGSQKQ